MKALKAALIAATMLIATIAAKADTTGDPLHGFCVGCAPLGGVIGMPPGTLTFGFNSSPAGLSGTLFLDFLEPSNSTQVISSVTGFATGTAVLFSVTPWTSGTLENYLGAPFNAGQPVNPIDAFLPATKLFDATATGYLDYTLNAGAISNMSGQCCVPNDLFTLQALLPLGTIIAAFLIEADNTVVATASSSALLVTPIPAAIWLFGSGLLGLIGLSRRRKAA